MLGRLGASAKLALRIVPLTPLSRAPGTSFALRLAPFSNLPAKGSSSNGLPTPWAPKHPNLGKTPQEMVRYVVMCAIPVAPATVETSLLQISEVPVIMVSGDRVSCDGGTDPRLGHPRVYLNLHKGDAVSCPYCGLRCVFCFLHLCAIWNCNLISF
jgi:NADH dehydrogenase (ubiquinone) Fe-S protein 6